MVRSGCGAGGGFATLVANVGLLFEQLLSVAAEQVGSTRAVSVRFPVLPGAVVLIVSVALPPALTAPPVHLTVGVTKEHENRLVPEALTNATPVGSVSSTSTPVAL